MRLTPEELALLDADAAAGRLPPEPPALPGIDEPATLAALIAFRTRRLGRA